MNISAGVDQNSVFIHCVEYKYLIKTVDAQRHRYGDAVMLFLAFIKRRAISESSKRRVTGNTEAARLFSRDAHREQDSEQIHRETLIPGRITKRNDDRMNERKREGKCVRDERRGFHKQWDQNEFFTRGRKGYLRCNAAACNMQRAICNSGNRIEPEGLPYS